MRHPVILWTSAFLITAASAVYQRVTGPTHPVTEYVILNGADVRIRLERTHSGEGDFPVVVQIADLSVSGFVSWKRHKTNDTWKETPFIRSGDSLRADLPHQPLAGKLAYRLVLRGDRQTVFAPSDGAVVVRFKGDVPLLIIIIHVVVIFSALMLSNRTALEVFSEEPRYNYYALLTVVLLFLGGLIFGPIVQKYAFDAYWTGWPFGHDLTDNKTGVAFLAWLSALLSLRRSTHPRRWILMAAVVTLAISLIPHSLLGSEFDYSSLEATQ